jgi:hypothetical protein
MHHAEGKRRTARGDCCVDPALSLFSPRHVALETVLDPKVRKTAGAATVRTPTTQDEEAETKSSSKRVTLTAAATTAAARPGVTIVAL